MKTKIDFEKLANELRDYLYNGYDRTAVEIFVKSSEYNTSIDIYPKQGRDNKDAFFNCNEIALFAMAHKLNFVVCRGYHLGEECIYASLF